MRVLLLMLPHDEESCAILLSFAASIVPSSANGPMQIRLLQLESKESLQMPRCVTHQSVLEGDLTSG